MASFVIFRFSSVFISQFFTIFLPSRLFPSRPRIFLRGRNEQLLHLYRDLILDHFNFRFVLADQPIKNFLVLSFNLQKFLLMAIRVNLNFLLQISKLLLHFLQCLAITHKHHIGFLVLLLLCISLVHQFHVLLHQFIFQVLAIQPHQNLIVQFLTLVNLMLQETISFFKNFDLLSVSLQTSLERYHLIR